MQSNRFELLSDNEESNKCSNLTLSNNDMEQYVKIQYNKEEKKRSRKLRKYVHKVKKHIKRRKEQIDN